MKKNVLTVVVALVVGVLGFAAAGALADNGGGNGNGKKPPGGTNPCPPSQHAVYDQDGNFVRCEDNGNPSGEPGGGIGNCGQNQSGNQGNGNGGNNGNGGDTGYGNGDGCTETTTTTPTSTTTTETTTTETTTSETTPTETTPSQTTTPASTPTQQQTSGPSSQPSSPQPASPSFVGKPPKAQHNEKQTPVKPAVAGLSKKSEPKPTRQPQPAPFTL